MSEEDDIRSVLASVQSVGTPPVGFGEAVASHLTRRGPTVAEPDPEIYEALRRLRDQPEPIEGELLESVASMTTSSLCVSVDFLDLVDRYDEAEAYNILGKLKDLLG